MRAVTRHHDYQLGMVIAAPHTSRAFKPIRHAVQAALRYATPPRHCRAFTYANTPEGRRHATAYGEYATLLAESHAAA